MELSSERDQNSFQVLESTMEGLDELCYYDSHYMLVLMLKSSGIRVVGDNVSMFLPGDLVLLGPNLPHLWRNDPTDYTGLLGIDMNGDKRDLEVKSIIVRFKRDFLGEEFFNVPEFLSVNELLENAKKGVCFNLHTNKMLFDCIVNLTNKKGAEGILSFLEVLVGLSQMKDKQVLTFIGVNGGFVDKKNRQGTILKYLLDNFSNEIRLEEIADVAQMSPNSFCRYFRNLTHKPFSTFLNELRIQDAVRMIALNVDSIKNISYKVGYKSVTNFNRQFKKEMHMTPMQYKQSIKED